MKARYVILFLVLEAALFSGISIYYSWRRDHIAHIKSYLTYIQSAVQVYSFDSLREERNHIYPISLQELVKKNYLDRSDYYKIHRFIPNLRYQEPSDGKPSDIIMTGDFFGISVKCPLYGNVRSIPEAEQGAAANP